MEPPVKQVLPVRRALQVPPAKKAILGRRPTLELVGPPAPLEPQGKLRLSQGPREPLEPQGKLLRSQDLQEPLAGLVQILW